MLRVVLGTLAASQIPLWGDGVADLLPRGLRTGSEFVRHHSQDVHRTAMMRSKVRLDAPVRTYLPDFAVRDRIASRDVTVLDLLTHMSGWEGDVFEDTGEGDDAVARYVANLKKNEQVAPLRRLRSYNNSGFIVTARFNRFLVNV